MQDRISHIVAAYASRPDVSPDEIVALYRRLAGEFDEAPQTAAAPRAPETPGLQPALPLEQAVTEDKVYCLCCGRGFKMLKRHLGSEHGLSEDEYRTLFNLPADMPLVAPSYSARKAAYAKKVGLGKHSRDDLQASLHDA